MKEESNHRQRGCMIDDSAIEIIESLPKEIDIKLRASCVWGITDFDAPKEKIKENAEGYGITYEDAMKWREYYINLFEQRKLYEESLNAKKERN